MGGVLFNGDENCFCMVERMTQGWVCEDGQLFFRKVTIPALQDHEVRLQVKACGINRADLLQKAGYYKNLSTAVLGLEVSGVVMECGNQVTGLLPGDKVMALVEGGGYSDVVNAAADLCIKIPPSFSFVQAAALPEALFTWWNAFYQFYSLSAQDALLIHGGAGGIGVIGIQLARLFDAKVFVTVSNQEKAALCQRLGAFSPIVYTQEDFATRIMQLTQNQGVNYIMDCVGGEYVSKNLECLKPYGILVMIAAQRGIKSSVHWGPLLLKNLKICGSTLRDKPLAVKAVLAQKMEPILKEAFLQEKIRPVVFKTFPLNEADRALDLMQSRQHYGKIVLNLE